MSKDIDVWRFHGGRVYDYEELKLPSVVKLVESLDYNSMHPLAVDIGGGNCSLVHSARLPRPQYFRTATIDIAASFHGYEHINPIVKSDVEEIITEVDFGAVTALDEFLLSNVAECETPGADLLVYSEILNYVDFREVMSWFDSRLKPGGYTVIANLPTRGWSQLFSDHGVKSHDELLTYVQDDLGHMIIRQEYPWGATDDYEGFMVLATQKPM
ncbi:hypothetical protein KBD20_00710 [Candidatus Saccharibacteria bacterium]|nr:hypothetical protein [Candidatus Saccharibacteria bacterium]